MLTCIGASSVSTVPADIAGLTGRSVMAIFAHPDDESFACGGTLALLREVGVRVVLVCASRGERGGLEGPVKDDDLGDIRVGELREAACILGISDLIILRHPDGDLRWADVTEFEAEIVMAIRRYAPAAVIT